MLSFFRKFLSKKTPTPPHIQSRTDLRGTYVLVRIDVNVPVRGDGSVSDDDAVRIFATLPTLQFLIDQGAKIIAISHCGNADDTLAPVATFMKDTCNLPVTFIPCLFGQEVDDALAQLGEGEILLLENLRNDAREKNNNLNFARALAAYADVYVNEAFSASHREHASIVSIPQVLPTYFGFQFHKEYTALSAVLDPKHPLLVIVGGAKFDTKLPLINAMLKRADTLFVGGALAHTFFVHQGHTIGASLFEAYDAIADLAKRSSVMIPRDVIVTTGEEVRTTTPDAITPLEKIVDLGPATLEALAPHITKARTIIWNGPLGWYEGGFDGGTQALLEKIAEAPGFSIIGGGDTVAVVRAHHMEDRFGFVSTAGGAMLDFLIHETLPGIDAVMK
ncbi:MAG: phosphoglycerate kinase [Candidatus Pacebacteria bacterium]|nr:phosphoglycerate kinase [Candidatus Paceibacterota bacterium]MCD8528200.1 phosphoglycerate kinase [Candidatus Paceibacterota bacterium]MCD8563839.1 phosphoglycerate kinase [Candidatus Paceibacterota bacterium]